MENIYQHTVTEARLNKAYGALVNLPLDFISIQKPVINYEEGLSISETGMIIDLTKNELIKPSGLTDRITSIENVVGTHFDDIIIGNDEDNELNGLDGNDNIYGKGGNDKLIFGYGKSNLYGGDGDDKFMFADSSMNYKTIVIAGVANIYGGEGYDTLDLRLYPLAIQVNMNNGSISYNTQAIYIIESVENLIATNFNDEIYDSKNDDNINSGAGNDIIYLTDGEDFVNACDGNDVIYLSGSGEKRLWGGNGDNTYVIMPSFVSYKNTIIIDFKPFSDKIDLTNLKQITALPDLKFKEITENNPPFINNLNFTIVTISENKELALYEVYTDQLSSRSFIFYEPEIIGKIQNSEEYI